MENIIKVDNLIFEYTSDETTYRAIDDFNLDIKKGEFVAIIGHNGSGKSTLSKNLNAILVPTSGDINIKGMNTKDEKYLWDIRQTAGMVFQNPDNQIVATIVEEDVAFGCENLAIDPQEIRLRVDEALKNVDMYDLRERQPHLLSGGQKQRVAIAGIIAMRPECIIFDEATAMLDPSGRQEVMVMEKGKLALEGTPREVFSNVTRLKEIGLDVPYMTELAHLLKKDGLDIRDNILTVDEMVGELCQLR